MLLVTASEMQELDARAIEDFGIPGLILMENAGRGTAGLIMEHFPHRLEKGAVVLAGPGNNGGDGFVIARHLRQQGADVEILVLAPREKFRGDAHVNYEIARRLGLPVTEILDEKALAGAWPEVAGAGVLVDALFGTGLAREIGGLFYKAVEMVNGSGAPVVAVDMPSGLSADTGFPLGAAVRADMTATMAMAKVGQVIHPGVEYTGELRIVDIGIPEKAVREAELEKELLEEASVRAMLKKRPASGHKGTFGHLVVLSGSPGKTGAAALVARGALRSGSGLVTAGCPESVQPVLAEKLTEAMTEKLPEGRDGCLSAESLDVVMRLLEKKSAVALGPGTGVGPETSGLIRELASEIRLPMVLDADALSALGTGHSMLMNAKGPRVLTPHPGEMGRLLGCSASDVQKDRLGAARRLAVETGAVAVLKGARTVIAAPDGRLAVNPTGNQGMGAGGMGDVLTGVIGGLLAQGYGPWEASCVGVFAHGLAADHLAKAVGPWGYLAGEVVDWLPRLWKMWTVLL